MKRLLAGGIILLMLVVSMHLIDGDQVQAASLGTGTSSSGPAGSTVRVTGEGYTPLLEVDLCWDDRGCDDLGSTGAGLGSFSTTVTIPSDSEPDVYEIYACQLGGVLDPVTCAFAYFEVTAEEPDTTTTTIVEATTTTKPPSTSGPEPTTTTTSGSSSSTATTTPPTTTATTMPTDDESEPPTLVVEEPTPPPTEPAVSQVPVAASTSESTDETVEVLESTITPAARPYTPPTLADADSTSREPDAQLPTLAVEQVEEASQPTTPSMLSWLEDPLLFWAIWLAAVAVAAMVALAIVWLARRGRHQA